MAFTYHNHYVPRLYLKHFATASGHIYMYRMLVSRSQVPVWKRVHIAGVGYQLHLYTRFAFGSETDEIEGWLNQGFETPAEKSLQKATRDERMDRQDWHNLVNFAAAQIVRTPAFLLRNLPRWHELAPRVLNDTMDDARREIELAKRQGRKITLGNAPNAEYFPLRVTREIVPGEQAVKVKAEILVGRGMWFYCMKHSLLHTAKILHEHKWSILKAPEGLSWFTSDDPVITLNFQTDSKYDFEGGWNRARSEILLPLSPHHLLYTQIGVRPPRRGTVLPYNQVHLIRRFIAEHAHRQIFSSCEESEIPQLRPRTVNADIVRDENESWGRWNEEQTKVEQRLNRR